MGCRSSIVQMETDGATADVDRMLREAEEAEKNHFKILLLGAGESGKSTVVKQIQMLYKGGIPESERLVYVENIRQNTIECMQSLIDARKMFEIPLGDPSLAEAESRVEDAQGAEPEATLVTDLESLWRDPAMQAVYERRNEFWLLDATTYYMAELRRLFDADFEPTEEDMLMTRVRTTGIALTDFEEKPYSYQMVDVGGQRNERRKWIHCFDDVKGIIFLVGLSGYHQVLFEDNSTNRMHESLELFSDITKNPLFREVPFFVLLNKKDLFEEMIPHTDLNTCFPDYTGGKDVRAACTFVENKFREVMERNCPGKGCQVHIVAARVRMDMKIALADVKDEMKKKYAQPDKKKKKKKR